MIEKISFEEIVTNDVFGEVTAYFTGPVSLLERYKKKYDDACMVTISITLPHDCYDPDSAVISMSPTRDIDGSLEDYDWFNIELPRNEVEELLKIIKQHI